MSSFGSPGGRQFISKPIPTRQFPPGPLWYSCFQPHWDLLNELLQGECKEIMLEYLSCMKKAKGSNSPECRNAAKSYLSCRMDKNLMAKDDFKNLGFEDNSTISNPERKKVEEQGAIGELRW